MQLKVKPAILTKIFTKLIQEGQAGLSLMTNRLGRQLQGRRVPHESDQLELQGLGREPPKLLTNKRRIPLRSASVRTYTFSPWDSQGSCQSAEQGDYKRLIYLYTLATQTLTMIKQENN
jgi:hypothetical protein